MKHQGNRGGVAGAAGIHVMHTDTAEVQQSGKLLLHPWVVHAVGAALGAVLSPWLLLLLPAGAQHGCQPPECA
jgi:hypothetical protein